MGHLGGQAVHAVVLVFHRAAYAAITSTRAVYVAHGAFGVIALGGACKLRAGVGVPVIGDAAYSHGQALFWSELELCDEPWGLGRGTEAAIAALA